MHVSASHRFQTPYTSRVRLIKSNTQTDMLLGEPKSAICVQRFKQQCICNFIAFIRTQVCHITMNLKRTKKQIKRWISNLDTLLWGEICTQAVDSDYYLCIQVRAPCKPSSIVRYLVYIFFNILAWLSIWRITNYHKITRFQTLISHLSHDNISR